MRHIRREDALGALLVEIEEFDRHESVPRALAAIDEAFDVCGTFADQERLVATLVSMAQSHYFAFLRVVERLWLQAAKWEGEERGRTLGAIAWYLAPSIMKWSYPLPREQIQADLARQSVSEIQTFLIARQREIWCLVANEDIGVATGAIMVLGTMQCLDGGDLELMLDAAAQSGEPVALATALLSVGRAGQYARASYGPEATSLLVRTIGSLVSHSNVWVNTVAVGTLALLELPIPASAREVLATAIQARRPIPDIWRPAGAFWKEDTSLQVACTILTFARLSPSERLIAALNQVPEGTDKRDAIAALDCLTHSTIVVE